MELSECHFYSEYEGLQYKISDHHDGLFDRSHQIDFDFARIVFFDQTHQHTMLEWPVTFQWLFPNLRVEFPKRDLVFKLFKSISETRYHGPDTGLCWQINVVFAVWRGAWRMCVDWPCRVMFKKITSYIKVPKDFKQTETCLGGFDHYPVKLDSTQTNVNVFTPNRGFPSPFRGPSPLAWSRETKLKKWSFVKNRQPKYPSPNVCFPGFFFKYWNDSKCRY